MSEGSTGGLAGPGPQLKEHGFQSSGVLIGLEMVGNPALLPAVCSPFRVP